MIVIMGISSYPRRIPQLPEAGVSFSNKLVKQIYYGKKIGAVRSRSDWIRNQYGQLKVQVIGKGVVPTVIIDLVDQLKVELSMRILTEGMERPNGSYLQWKNKSW